MKRLEKGARIGNAVVEQEIGRGAFGRVFSAFDSLIERRVALKEIPDLPDALRDNRRILQEARTVGALDSRNIVTLHRVYPPEQYEAWILEMEFVDGGTLEDLLAREGALDPARAVEIAKGIANGLRAAHDHGVIHGDLKPGNVLLTSDGRPKLADFGLAQLLRDTSAEAESWAGLIGTPSYMAPEVIMAEPLTAAADIWSFGVVLYRLLAGHLPFAAQNASQLFCAIQATEPTPLRPSLPPGLVRLVGRCLSKPPGERPENGTQALEELSGLDMLVREVAAPPPKKHAWPIGRSATGEQLRSAMRAPRPAGAFLVSGDAGMGKTVLLDALLQVAIEERFTIIRVDPGTDGDVVAALEDALQTQVAAKDAGARIRAVIGELASRGRTILAVDDVHTVGEIDLAALKQLVRTAAREELLLFLVGRRGVGAEPELGSLDAVTSLTLEPLPRETCFRMLQQVAQGEVAAEVFDEIFRLTNGNPAFARELLWHLLESGVAAQDNGVVMPGPRWGDETLPKRVKDLTALKLKHLSDSDRALVEAAAVDGMDFDGEALAAVLDERLLPVLQQLQRLTRGTRVVRTATTGFRFVDPLAREVLYRALSPELRRALHLAFAQHLATRPTDEVRPARLGVHWLRAGDAERARPHLAAALREASAHQAWRLAVRLGRWAAFPAETDRGKLLEFAETLISLAASYHNLARSKEAGQLLDRLRQAAADAGDATLELRIAVRAAGQTFWRDGPNAVDKSALRRAVDALPDCLERGHALYLLGVTAKYEGQLADAEGAMRDADSVFRKLGLDDRHASALDQLASIAKRREQLSEAEALYADSARISTIAGRPINAAVSEVNRAQIAFGRGALDGLSDRLRQAVDALTVEGATALAAQGRIELSRVLYATGDLHAAVVESERAWRTLEESRQRYVVAEAAIEHAHILGVLGRLDEAAPLIERGMELAAATDQQEIWEYGAAVRLQQLCWAGRTSDVGSCLDELVTRDGELDQRAALLIAEAAMYGAPVEAAARVLRRAPEPEPALTVLAAADRFRRDDEQAAPALRAGAEALVAARPGERRETLSILADLFEAEAARRVGDGATARRVGESVTRRCRDLGHAYLLDPSFGDSDGSG